MIYCNLLAASGIVPGGEVVRRLLVGFVNQPLKKGILQLEFFLLDSSLTSLRRQEVATISVSLLIRDLLSAYWMTDPIDVVAFFGYI
jgi:hypothetical protein